MRSDNNKLNLKEFIYYFCGFYLLYAFWFLITIVLFILIITFLHLHGNFGAFIFLVIFYGILFGLLLYLYYWIAKGLILGKTIRAFLAILLINFPSYFSFKYNYNSIMINIYNIILSTFLLYSVIFSFREKKRWKN
jgi:ABC-type antimicrobial peptide transport system permease subunit